MSLYLCESTYEGDVAESIQALEYQVGMIILQLLLGDSEGGLESPICFSNPFTLA